MMKDFLENPCKCVEVERTEPADLTGKKKREAFHIRPSGAVCKPPYAAPGGNFRGGER